MLKLNNVTKRFGARSVLEGVCFVLNDGEVVGVVGPNGSGKTTLLNVIAALEPRDAGSVEMPAATRIGYLRQGNAADPDRPVADVFPAAFELPRGEARVAALADRLAREGPSPEIEAQYEAAVAALRVAPAATDEAWRALQLRSIEPHEPIGRLSGGEQTKLGLVELAASRPDVLLLDEPTNNLDLDALAWLDAFIGAFAGPVLVVSHDRALLDDHASAILEIDPRTGRLKVYDGTYEAYAAEKARREEELWARFRRQQEHERRLNREIRDIKQVGRGREHMSQNDYLRRRNKKFVRRAVVLERRLERELASAERVEKPQRNHYRVKADLAPSARGGDRMLAAEGVALEAGARALLTGVSLTIGWGERVVLIGSNGAGKTTLLRALAGELVPSAGRVTASPSAKIGDLPQVEREASPAVTPVDLMRAAAPLSATEARRFLHRFLFSGDNALTPVARLSYGERRRLSLATLVLGGANVLLLDEPTNHLDIPSREAFEAALDSYEGAMLAVTHDRYFIDRFAGRVLELREGALREV